MIMQNSTVGDVKAESQEDEEVMSREEDVLPEELPGVAWDMSHGARMTADMINEDVGPQGPEGVAEARAVAANPDVDRRAVEMGALALSIASRAAPEGGTMIAQLRAVVDALGAMSPDQLKAMKTFPD